MSEENSIRKVLRSEITVVIAIGLFLWGMVTTVVLPLQKLQIQVSQIQLDITTTNKKYDDLSKKNDTNTAGISSLGSRTSVLEAEMNNIFKK